MRLVGHLYADYLQLLALHALVHSGHGGQAQPDARTPIIEELNPRLLKRRLDLRKCRGTCADFSAEGFHAADGADGDVRTLRQLDMFPVEQCSRGPQLSASNQRTKLAWERF